MTTDADGLGFYGAIGRRIKLARTGHGLSQADLASMAGYGSPTTISYYEAGLRKPGLYDLQKIALALGLSLGELLDMTGEATAFLREWEWLPLETLRTLRDPARADLLSCIDYLAWRERTRGA